MSLYYIIIFLCIASFFFNRRVGESIGWSAFILMTCMTLFRGDYVGTDTMNYLTYDEEHRIEEFIITYITGFIRVGSISERSIIYVTCIVTYLFSFLNIKRYRIDVRYFCLFFLIYGFFSMGLNISRQIAATSIIAYFLPYIFNDDKKKSLLFFVGCVFAAGFHISSLYLVYLYVFRFFHFKNNNIPILIFVLGIVVLFDILPINLILSAFLPETYTSAYSKAVLQNEEVSLIGYGYRVIVLGIYGYLYKYLNSRKDVWLFVFSAIIVNATIGMDFAVARIFNINSYIIVIFSCLAFTDYNMKRDGKLKMLFWFQVIMGLYMTLTFIQNHPDLRNFEFA